MTGVRFMAMGEQFARLHFMTAAPGTEVLNPLVETRTPRELDRLEKLCEGLSNKEVARAWEAGTDDKLHMKTLYRKLAAHNRTQAAPVAKEAGHF